MVMGLWVMDLFVGFVVFGFLSIDWKMNVQIILQLLLEGDGGVVGSEDFG